MFLNGISFDFCKKPRNVHCDLNSVFSLSYKISFADLWSLFMERITYVSTNFFVENLILNNFYIYIFSLEHLIFKISVKEWKFPQFHHEWPSKLRNTYNGGQNTLLSGGTTELWDRPYLSFSVNCAQFVRIFHENFAKIPALFTRIPA